MDVVKNTIAGLGIMAVLAFIVISVYAFKEEPKVIRPSDIVVVKISALVGKGLEEADFCWYEARAKDFVRDISFIDRKGKFNVGDHLRFESVKIDEK